MTISTSDTSKIECSIKRDSYQLCFKENEQWKGTFLQTFCRYRNYIYWNSLSITCSICMLWGCRSNNLLF